ncbi:hypothetical protein [Schlesneria sp. T3-172]|uniref:hypothetical protein n=1 Tax=Schlesneria sphaerica TaxID=3373610 RepID=UPI0037CB5C48
MSDITDEWLRSVGFKYDTPDPRNREQKHWTLWFGDCIPGCSGDELAIELSHNRADDWFCWLRSDMAHRYHRFIHVRHMHRQEELIRLIEGISGQTWDPANNAYGVIRTPETAESLRRESERLDRRFNEQNCKWDTTERDPDMSKPNLTDRRIARGGKRIIGGKECDD